MTTLQQRAGEIPGPAGVETPVDGPARHEGTTPPHGWYWVTARDGDRWAFLAGPFVGDHAAALESVPAVRSAAEMADPRAAFYAFGTAGTSDLGPIPAGPFNADVPGHLRSRLLSVTGRWSPASSPARG